MIRPVHLLPFLLASACLHSSDDNVPDDGDQDAQADQRFVFTVDTLFLWQSSSPPGLLESARRDFVGSSVEMRVLRADEISQRQELAVDCFGDDEALAIVEFGEAPNGYGLYRLHQHEDGGVVLAPALCITYQPRIGELIGTSMRLPLSVARDGSLLWSSFETSFTAFVEGVTVDGTPPVQLSAYVQGDAHFEELAQ